MQTCHAEDIETNLILLGYRRLKMMGANGTSRSFRKGKFTVDGYMTTVTLLIPNSMWQTESHNKGYAWMFEATCTVETNAKTRVQMPLIKNTYQYDDAMYWLTNVENIIHAD